MKDNTTFEQKQQIARWAAAFIQNSLTDEEGKALYDWLLSSAENRKLFAYLTDKDTVQRIREMIEVQRN